MRRAIPKSLPNQDCPKCGAKDAYEFQPDDWEGDPSEPGGVLMHRIPASWWCAECEHTDKWEPDDNAGNDYDPEEYHDRKGYPL